MGCETRRSNRNQEDTSSTRNLLSVLLFVVGAERGIIKNRLAPGARRQGSGFPGPLGGVGGRPHPRCRRETGRGSCRRWRRRGLRGRIAAFSSKEEVTEIFEEQQPAE